MGQRGRRPRRAGGRRQLSGTLTVLDLSGAEELCTEPAPLERVRRAFAHLAPGDRLEVRTPIAEHAFAVRAWSGKQGVTIISDERDGRAHRIELLRGAAPPGTEPAHSSA
jgi:TusA-related sulfurtransferase